MFEREIFVTDQRSQHLFDSTRIVFGDSLKRDDGNVRILYVVPYQVAPVWSETLGFIIFEYAFESREIRQKHYSVEIVAEDRNLCGSCKRIQVRIVGNNQFLAQFSFEQLGCGHPGFRITALAQKVLLESLER